MLLEKLRYYREASKMTFEHLAEESKTPLSTLKNIFSGKCEPLASTLYRITQALNISLEDVLVDSNVVLSHKSLVEVKENAEIAEAERDLISAENAILKDKVAALTAENDMLKREIKHKEEIIALHNYYNKLKSND